MLHIMHARLYSSGVSAAERVYDQVKSRILTGEYAAGALLSEVEVATELDVSRTPAHEAFRRLEAEELLQLIPRRGAVVVPVGPREAADILEVRHALETAAVRRLAGEGAAEARARLHDRLAGIVAEQRAHAAAGDVTAFAAADEAFHRAIVSASGNAIADRFYATLADRQRRMTVGSVGGRPGHLPVLIAEHEALAGCVAAQQADRFDHTLLAHLHATHRTLIGGPA
jgi:DNA-binding GntR family transcriptional regulator